MQILPAIDIRGGKCVRLKQGDYLQETVYGSSPADMAHRWVADGATELHIVDLDGARDGKRVNQNAIAKILSEVAVPLQLGGGIRDENTISDYLKMGVSKLVIGTKALTDPDWLARMCQQYPQQLAISIDARHGRAATDGWRQLSDVSAVDLARRISQHPIAGIIYTDISKDGMMSGPNFAAMEEMAAAVDVPLICSGGVTTPQDISQLSAIGLAGCVVGRALYEGRMTLHDALEAANTTITER